MTTTTERRWTAAPPDDELLTLLDVVAYAGLDPANPDHVALVDGELFEADQPTDGQGAPERWFVGTIRAWLLRGDGTGDGAPVLPGDSAVLDLAGIARYLRVASTTPQQWRQREVLLKENPLTSFPDKPTWLQGEVRTWAIESEPTRWPPGVAGRKE